MPLEMGGIGSELDVARLPERRQGSVAAVGRELGNPLPGMRFVAAANIGTYTCAANMVPQRSSRLREHGSGG